MEVFLLHAGVSIERLAKATLAKKSPFLLMEMKGKDDTLYHLAGVRQTAKLRTIGASQAIRRLRDMAVLPPSDPDLDELIELRNGVAHLKASVDDAFDGLTVFCKATNHLLDHLGENYLEYWGSWETFVDITLNAMQEKTEGEVARRMERARWLLNKRFEDLPVDAQNSFLASRPKLSGYQVTSGKIFVPWPCPVCRSQAFIVTGPPLLLRHGNPGIALSERFLCLACELSLRDQELQVVGIPLEVPLVDLAGERLMTDAEEYLWQFSPINEDEVPSN